MVYKTLLTFNPWKRDPKLKIQKDSTLKIQKYSTQKCFLSLHATNIF